MGHSETALLHSQSSPCLDLRAVPGLKFLDGQGSVNAREKSQKTEITKERVARHCSQSVVKALENTTQFQNLNAKVGATARRGFIERPESGRN